MSDAHGIFAEEPPDGTRLVVWEDSNPPFVVWRDDAAAKKLSYASDDERWFSAYSDDPATLGWLLTDATMVHAVVPLNASGLKLVDKES